MTHYDVDVIEAFVALPWWADHPMETIDDGKTTWQTKPLVESMEEAVAFNMPDASDPGVYADIENKRSAYPDKAIFAMLGAPLMILEPLRLAENLFLDLYDSVDEIHHILKRVRLVLIDAARRACSMDIDVLYLAGDICSRDGAMVSLKQLREFNFDYIREVIDIAREAGKKVFYHSDGMLMNVLDIYMEYGIDGCNPLEPRYNDPHEFLTRTNGKMMLYGGIDNCDVIPNGTIDQIRDHICGQFNILGKEGRLIFSSHDIPGHCPQENLDAMLDSIKSCRY